MFGLSHPENCDSAPLHRHSWAPLSTAPQNLQGSIQWRKRRHNSLCFGPQGSVSHLYSPPNTPVALLSSIMKHNYPYLVTSAELLCVWLGVRAPAPDWLNTVSGINQQPYQTQACGVVTVVVVPIVHDLKTCTVWNSVVYFCLYFLTWTMFSNNNQHLVTKPQWW